MVGCPMLGEVLGFIIVPAIIGTLIIYIEKFKKD